MPILEITIDLHSYCSLSCVHCSNFSEGEKKGLSIDYLRNLLNDPMLKKIRVANLSGGEPLDYDKISEIIQFLSSKNIICIVYSSGVISKRNRPFFIPLDIAVELKEKGLTHVFLSIYDMHSKGYDKITRIPGSFELLCKSINNLLCAGILVNAHIIPLAYNCSRLESIISWCVDQEFSHIRILRFVSQGLGSKNSVFLSFKDRTTQYLTHLYYLKKKFEKKIEFSIAGYPANFKCRPYSFMMSGCRAGMQSIHVNWDNTTIPCASCKGFQPYRRSFMKNLTINEYLKKWNLEKYRDSINKNGLDETKVCLGQYLQKLSY